MFAWLTAAMRVKSYARARNAANVEADAQLLDGGIRVAQRLAVPALLVLDGRDALALHRTGDDRNRLAVRGGRLLVGLVDGGHVMAVDLERAPAEGLGPAHVGGRV